MKIPDHLPWKATGKTLGEGGQGRVYEVIRKDDPNGQKFALKALSPGKPAKAYQRFFREIEAIQNRLAHPSIIKILDHSEEGDPFHYYVMELVPGAVPLKKLLGTQENPFFEDPISSLRFFINIVEAIEACASIQVVHRDLSPANVLVLPDRTIKIIDFGLCQIEGEEAITLVDGGSWHAELHGTRMRIWSRGSNILVVRPLLCRETPLVGNY